MRSLKGLRSFLVVLVCFGFLFSCMDDPRKRVRPAADDGDAPTDDPLWDCDDGNPGVNPGATEDAATPGAGT